MRCDETRGCSCVLVAPDCANHAAARHMLGGRYNLRITDQNYFALSSFGTPIFERDLTLENVAGTSFDVGPDNLATFAVSAGTALASFVSGTR